MPEPTDLLPPITPRKGWLPRLRFSLRTLVILVLLIGSCATLWLQYLNSPSDKVRQEVVNGIGKLNPSHLTVLSLRAATKDPAEAVQKAAMAALKQIEKQ
jgi:glucan phosphoethanolaminetransferase (alkaline phosphatase superfamily)